MVVFLHRHFIRFWVGEDWTRTGFNWINRACFCCHNFIKTSEFIVHSTSHYFRNRPWLLAWQYLYAVFIKLRAVILREGYDKRVCSRRRDL